MMDSMIEQASITAASVMGKSIPIPIPETVLAALMAAEAAFIERGFRRLVRQGELLMILARVREFADWRVQAEFGGRFLWGVLKGLASPVTGLVQFAISGIELAGAAGSWALKHMQHKPDVAAEANALAAEFGHFAAVAVANLQSLRSKEGALTFASAVFSAAEAAGTAIEHELVRMAREKGRQAADSLVDELRHRPLPQLAEIAGEIIGTVVIELVLLVFSEGIGNLISKLGEFARALRPLSRGVGVLADVLVTVGGIIAKLEHIVGTLMQKTVLRPLMPLLEALEPLLARVRQFARRAVGMSEEAATGIGRLGARTLASEESTAAGATERAASAPPPKRPVQPPQPPIADIPRRPGGVGPPGVRGATAEGVGEKFRYQYHPERPTPPVESRPTPPGGRTQRPVYSAEPGPTKPSVGERTPAAPEPKPPSEEEENWDIFKTEQERVPPERAIIEAEETEPPAESPIISPTRHQRLSESRRASDELAANMAKEGNPRPPGHDTHHIAAYNDPRAREACDILEEAGINPRNDPRNGIHLPRTTTDPRTRPEAYSRHPTIHTEAYYKNLTKRLRQARDNGTVEQTLADIYSEIAVGQFPHPKKRY
jgi:hypothetical protein